MTYRSAVLTALAALVLVPTAWGQERKVLDKTQAEWIKILEGHKEKRYRRAAVLALASPEFGRSKEVITALTRALGADSEADVRREIAVTLGTFKDDAGDSADALALRLEKDDSPKVREAAARAMGQMPNYAGIHVMRLGKALKDADPDTRTAAAEALEAFGDRARKVLPQLAEAAGNPRMETFTRVYAVRILARFAAKDEKTVQLLVGILGEKGASLDLRQATAGALGTMGPQALSAVPVLARTFEDDKFDGSRNKEMALDVRRAAGTALAKIGPKAVAALPAVIKVLHDPDNGLRTQAVRLAGVLGKDNPQVAEVLLGLLKDEKNAEVLVAAIQESGELSIHIALRKMTELKLTELANDPRATVREAARLSLKKLRGEK